MPLSNLPPGVSRIPEPKEHPLSDKLWALLEAAGVSEAVCMEADTILWQALDEGVPDPMEAQHNRDRARFRTVLNLMGVDHASANEASAKMADAIKQFPDGHLAFTHAPVDPEHPTPLTFETLVAMWWQDDEYGAHFNELLWSKQS